MQRIIWVPGLQGEKALTHAYTSAVGANEAAVKKAARDSAWRFQKLDYQSHTDKNPTLSRMEAVIAAQLDNAVNDAKGAPIILVGSSVGFGVTLGALRRFQNSTSPIALIGFKPVPDPLMAIELQINNPAVVGAIKSGAIPKAPMPVESADGLKDTFFLTAEHLNDKRALRILSNDLAAVAFNNAVGSQLKFSTLIYGTNDHLTPFAHMTKFANSVNAEETELVELNGTHANDFTDRLYQEVYQMVARFG